MANISTVTDLVINRLSKAKYDQLCASGQLEEYQLYITDDDMAGDLSNEIDNIKSDISTALTAKADVSSLPYTLATAALSSCTYNNAQCVSCQIEDRTITTISVDSNTPDVVVFLPEKQSATAARDFMLRVEISVSTAPGFTFVGVGNEAIQYDSEDDDWAVLEPGLNIVSFIETK